MRFFWSLGVQPKRDLRNHVRSFVRPFVRPSVRPFVTQFLENRSLLFSETLQLVRACKRDKNVPSAFLKKNPVSPILAKNCPKLAFLAQNAQKWRFFAFLSQSVHQNLLIFCTKPSLWSRKKRHFRIFWENSKMALFGQN